MSTETEMSDEEYLKTQHQIIFIKSLVSGLDLDGFLSRIEREESMGLILDPTLYRKASSSLSNVKEHASALRKFQMVGEKIRDTANPKH